MVVATATKEDNQGTEEFAGVRRGTLVNNSSPETRHLRGLIREIDEELQRKLLDMSELFVADEFHWVSARRQLLKLVNDMARLRLDAINQVLEG